MLCYAWFINWVWRRAQIKAVRLSLILKHEHHIKLVSWNRFKHHVICQGGPHELKTNNDNIYYTLRIEFFYTLNFERFEVKYLHCKMSPNLKLLFGIRGSKVVVEHFLKSNRSFFANDSGICATSIYKWSQPSSQSFRLPLFQNNSTKKDSKCHWKSPRKEY